ncbi:hypothetical protein [Lentibacillus cibarius]|nr:hypothetical protein [Lentibacillus cibarius]
MKQARMTERQQAKLMNQQRKQHDKAIREHDNRERQGNHEPAGVSIWT